MSNIQLRCRAHNLYEADLFFGADVVRDDKAWLALMEAAEALSDDLLAALAGMLGGAKGDEVRTLLRSCAAKVVRGMFKPSQKKDGGAA